MVRKLIGLLVVAAAGAVVATMWQDATRYLKIKMASSRPQLVPAEGRKAYLAHERGDDFAPARRGGPDVPEPGHRAGRR